jgi:hypothetical protein
VLGWHDPKRANYLLGGLPVPVVVAFLRAVAQRIPRNLHPDDVAVAFAACLRLYVPSAVLPDVPSPGGDKPPPADPVAQACAALYRFLGSWCHIAARRSVTRVGRWLRSFDERAAAEWDEFARPLTGPPLWRDFGEPDGR